MERQSAVLLALLCYAFFHTADSCLQNLPWYHNQGRMEAPRLPDRIQAIVPAYSFSCYGNVTQWGAFVEPPHMSERYQVEFQVWRPRSADGSYELIGSNTRGQLVPSNQQVMFSVEQQFQIQVEPGDIVGFYANHLNSNEGGIELDVDMQSVTVWYNRTPNQEYSPGHELQESELMSSTLGAPVITAAVVTVTPPPFVVQVQATQPISSSSQHTVSSSQVLISPPEEDGEGGAPQNIIIFAAVGGGAGLVFIIAAIAGICACVMRRRKADKTRDLTHDTTTNYIEMSGNAAYMDPQVIRRINTYLPQVPLVNAGHHLQHESKENLTFNHSVDTPTYEDHIYDYVHGDPYALANAFDTEDDTTEGSGYVINQLDYEIGNMPTGLKSGTLNSPSMGQQNGTETEGGITPRLHGSPTAKSVTLPTEDKRNGAVAINGTWHARSHWTAKSNARAVGDGNRPVASETTGSLTLPQKNEPEYTTVIM